MRDVADAHTRLIEPGRGPRRYVLGGHRLGGSELAAELTRITSRKIRHLAVPDSVVLSIGKIADRFANWLPDSMGKVSEASVRYLVDVPSPDNGPAESELGVTFRPPGETLEAMLADRAGRSEARQSDAGH